MTIIINIVKFRLLYVSDDNLFSPTMAAPDKERRTVGIRNTWKGSTMFFNEMKSTPVPVYVARKAHNIYDADKKLDPSNLIEGEPYSSRADADVNAPKKVAVSNIIFSFTIGRN